MSKKAGLFFIALLFASLGRARAQAPSDSCQNGPQLSLSYRYDGYGHAIVSYHISDLRGVKAAWVDLRGRPKRYRHVRVPVQIDGEVLLGRYIAEVDDRPSEISIAIFDAELLGYCIDFGCEKIRPGYLVSETELGHELGSEDPKPVLNGDPIRIPEGSDSTDLVLTGVNLTAKTRILLVEYRPDSSPSWVPKEWLNSDLMDLSHVRIRIPMDELSHAAILGAMAVPAATNQFGFEAAQPYLDSLTKYDHLRQNRYDGLYPGGNSLQSIVVASKDSPTLTSAEPSTIPFPNQRLTVTLHGTGFTANSRIATWNLQSGLTYGGESAEFVSSRELRMQMSGSQPIHGLFAPNGRMNIWVLGEDRFQVSDKIPISFASPNLKPDPLPARIFSISPYPLPYMDYRSPEQLLLTIYGEDFRRDDRIIALIDGHNGESHRTLKSQYLSQHEFHAWLPRKLWYSPVVTYALVIQKPGSRCSFEIEEDPKDHQRYEPAR